MHATHRFLFAMIPSLGLLLAGCGVRGTFGGAINATEERHLTAPHVPGSALDVHTSVGSVDIAADPSLKEVKVIAKVSAFGDTDEEAKARLQDIKVKLNRRDDGVLEIGIESSKEGQSIRGTCSFVISIPNVTGAKVRTGNGSVTLKGLGGAADVHTDVGAVSVREQGGNVTVQTGNGSVHVIKAAGDVQATTSVGKVTVEEAAGAAKAKSGNGSLEITKVGGAVEATSSVGSVTIRDAAGPVTASTGNGSIVVANVKGAVTAKSSVGQVTLDQVSGKAEGLTGNGSITYTAAPGSDSSFRLKADVGAVTIRLPASAGGSIQAGTSVGSVTVNGARRPHAVTGDRTSKNIVLTKMGPASSVHTGNGAITITLD
jgi:hypothetical protein